MEEGVVDASKGNLLLDEVCGVFEEERRKETMSRVSKDERRAAGEVDLSVESECVEVEALVCGKEGILN